MSKVLALLLRFGPLVAAFALGLAAVLEPLIPGYTGIVNNILGVLGFFGVTPDTEVVSELSGGVAGVLALIGFGRKLWSLIKAKYFTPLP